MLTPASYDENVKARSRQPAGSVPSALVTTLSSTTNSDIPYRGAAHASKNNHMKNVCAQRPRPYPLPAQRSLLQIALTIMRARSSADEAKRGRYFRNEAFVSL
jgi:hypothetical protein